MGQVDALSLVSEVRRRMVDLAMSDNYIRDPDVLKICHDFWKGPGASGKSKWIVGCKQANSARTATPRKAAVRPLSTPI